MNRLTPAQNLMPALETWPIGDILPCRVINERIRFRSEPLETLAEGGFPGIQMGMVFIHIDTVHCRRTADQLQSCDDAFPVVCAPEHDTGGFTNSIKEAIPILQIQLGNLSFGDLMSRSDHGRRSLMLESSGGEIEPLHLPLFGHNPELTAIAR